MAIFERKIKPKSTLDDTQRLICTIETAQKVNGHTVRGIEICVFIFNCLFSLVTIYAYANQSESGREREREIGHHVNVKCIGKLNLSNHDSPKIHHHRHILHVKSSCTIIGIHNLINPLCIGLMLSTRCCCWCCRLYEPTKYDQNKYQISLRQ